MKHLSRDVGRLFALAFLLTSLLNAEAQSNATDYTGLTLEGLYNGKSSFVVSVRTKNIDRKITVHSKHWGRSSQPEQRLIDSLLVNLSGNDVKLPDSAYDSLLNITLPGGIRAYVESGQFVLRIGGGDGGNAYVAFLYFARDKLVRREIFQGSGSTEDQTPIDVIEFR